MTWVPFAILWIFFVGIISWQLGNGIVLGRNWKPLYRRANEPKKYWAFLSLKMLLLLGTISYMTYLAFFSRHH